MHLREQDLKLGLGVNSFYLSGIRGETGGRNEGVDMGTIQRECLKLKRISQTAFIGVLLIDP